MSKKSKLKQITIKKNKKNIDKSWSIVNQTMFNLEYLYLNPIYLSR